MAETEKYAHVPIFSTAAWRSRSPAKSASWSRRQKSHLRFEAGNVRRRASPIRVIHAIEKGDFDAIIMNFANADMVGHSGQLEATIKACETVDECLGRIFQALRPRGGAWIITADHGNAETMIDPITGGPHTYHTTNPVPFILLTEDSRTRLQSGGSLRDIAPTLLGDFRSGRTKRDDRPRSADRTTEVVIEKIMAKCGGSLIAAIEPRRRITLVAGSGVGARCSLRGRPRCLLFFALFIRELQRIALVVHHFDGELVVVAVLRRGGRKPSVYWLRRKARWC